jgi:RNA polymerase sigma-70 factor (ECF subfamily)
VSHPHQGNSLPEERANIQRAQAGDKDAYRCLVEGYQDRLFRLVISMVARKELAEDLTQEIFIKAYFALPSFQGDSAFYTWLFRIASNHCLDHLRKRRPVEISLDQPLHDESDKTAVENLKAPTHELPGQSIETTSNMTDMTHLLDTLDPDQRLLLTLREVEGYSYEQLAVAMKCGVNTIKSRLNRTRKALKTVFARKYGSARRSLGEGGNISGDKTVLQGEEKP